MIARLAFPSVMALLILVVVFGCKDQGTTEPAPPDTTGGPIVRKPNIYLYPESSSQVSVRLEFPLGGSIIESIPEYGTGWAVGVQPDGKINGRYDYLYYEAQAPDRYQYTSGWVVHRDTLEQFFVSTMAQAGFSNREIADFIDYWQPLLISPLYEVYPQTTRVLDGLITLRVDPAPANQLRLFFVIQPAGPESAHLATPVVSPIERSGFFLAEWGVILKE